MKKGDVLRLTAATVFLGVSFGPAMRRIEEARRRRRAVHQPGLQLLPAGRRDPGDLAKQGDVIALAYHVDYWDYLGWQDTLATPDNTARQYEYAQILRRALGLYAAGGDQRPHPCQRLEPRRHFFDACGNLPNRAKASPSISR